MIGLRRYASELRYTIGFRHYHDLNLPSGAIEAAIKSTGAEPRFVWSIRSRHTRGETNSAMDWIVERTAKDSLIYEVGCGCGANLI